MLPPPTNQIFRIKEEATDFINNFTSMYGYALVDLLGPTHKPAPNPTQPAKKWVGLEK
jgi:hypothetical protein